VAWLFQPLCLGDARAAVIGKDLERKMVGRGTHADTAVIIRFADALDAGQLVVSDRRQRDNRLFQALKQRAARNRAALEPVLAAQGAVRVKDLWIINGVAATLPAVAVKELARTPGVERIDLDSLVQGGRSQRMPAARAAHRVAAAPDPAPAAAPPASAKAVPAWNVAAVRAPELWARGHTGHGVVVATMDTGVDLGHPSLLAHWRGGANSWFDPHGQEPRPYDALGHGTQTLGVIVGGPDIGVAPDARWIATRLYDADGHAAMSDIHLAFQWLMDPDGDPATLDAPDVVNASWALTGRAMGTCTLEFSEDMRALRNAGIVVVFAAGNDGPALATSNSPANNPGALSVGPVDRDLAIARQASRGPSACDGGLFPQLVAPGVNVRTTDLSHGGEPVYAAVSGSSLAAPHVAGVLALLAGAFPAASVAELEAALLRGARDLGEPGGDNLYGHGLVDALAAFKALQTARQADLVGAAVPAAAAAPIGQSAGRH
jgi:subtilisin family serine protease